MYNELKKVAGLNLKFGTKNVQDLWIRLDENDKKIFHFSLKNFNWSEFVEISVKGARFFILKESLDNLKESRERAKK